MKSKGGDYRRIRVLQGEGLLLWRGDDCIEAGLYLCKGQYYCREVTNMTEGRHNTWGYDHVGGCSCGESHSVVSDSMQAMEFSRPQSGVGSLSLLQRVFPTQGLNPGLLHCRRILHQLRHQGSPTVERRLIIKEDFYCSGGL